LLNAVEVLGYDAVVELLRSEPSLARSFYVFNDFGCGESGVFPTLRAAYDYFVSYIEGECGGSITKESWDEMADANLRDWIQAIETWRSEGGRRLPPDEWLGGYHSAMTGFTGRATL